MFTMSGAKGREVGAKAKLKDGRHSAGAAAENFSRALQLPGGAVQAAGPAPPPAPPAVGLASAGVSFPGCVVQGRCPRL